MKEIIYTVIAKKRAQVLSEFSDMKGNFELIANDIINKKISENTRGTICYEKV